MKKEPARRDCEALTADQFRTPVPYDEARGCGFLTRDPSARTKIVLRRVEHDAAD